MPEARKHTPRSILEAFYDAERIYMSAPRTSETSAASQPPLALIIDFYKPLPSHVKAPEIFESEGSNRVVVYSTVHFKVRATGEEVDYPFCQVVTVDLEKGVMTELMPFYWDVAQVNRMLGHTPKN
ncbi:hypothetical protein V2G26_005193 [Clonostachys chloroleuca]